MAGKSNAKLTIIFETGIEDKALGIIFEKKITVPEGKDAVTRNIVLSNETVELFNRSTFDRPLLPAKLLIAVSTQPVELELAYGPLQAQGAPLTHVTTHFLNIPGEPIIQIESEIRGGMFGSDILDLSRVRVQENGGEEAVVYFGLYFSDVVISL